MMDTATNWFTADVLHQKIGALNNGINPQYQRNMSGPSSPTDVSHTYRETADVGHVYHGETTAVDTPHDVPTTVQSPQGHAHLALSVLRCNQTQSKKASALDQTLAIGSARADNWR